MSLENKVAIVTGAARGIGEHIARRFLNDGAKVVLCDIDEAQGEITERELQKLGEARFVHADVSEKLDVRNLVAAALDAFGDVDILINNAGVAAKAAFTDITEDDFDRVLDVNLKGSFLASQAAARHWIERIESGGSPGVIVNVSSVNAVMAIPDQIAYVVSKGGLNQLTKATALALAPYGIRVNAVGPGSIATDMLAAVNTDASARARLLSRTPLGRIGEPREIAAVVAFLASEEASYITGQCIYADGGRLALNYTVPVVE